MHDWTPVRSRPSGNLGCRPKTLREVIEKAREYTGLAIHTLVSVMQDETAPARDRIAAAIAILDRGWGKPKEFVATAHLHLIGGTDSPPIPETVDEWLARRRTKLDGLDKDTPRH